MSFETLSIGNYLQIPSHFYSEMWQEQLSNSGCEQTVHRQRDMLTNYIMIQMYKKYRNHSHKIINSGPSIDKKLRNCEEGRVWDM